MPTPEAKPTNPCAGPNATAPAGSAVHTCPAGIPSSVPATCADAPASVALPPGVNSAMQQSYGNSFPGGHSQERGATLVQDSSGTVSVVNEGAGNTGTFSPNRSVPAGQRIIGIYHTHPYDATEGGHTGVSFSSADINYAIRHQEAMLVDAGTAQYMIMPTAETPTGNSAAVDADWMSAFQAAQANGRSFPEASRDASLAVACKYKMAYYEGANGTLARVSC